MTDIKILIDAFGSDNPDAFILGIAKALRELKGVNLVVTGNKEYIENKLIGEDFDRSRLEIIHTEQVVTNDDSPVEAIRKKRNSSLCVGLETLKNRADIDCMISAGNTGAVIAGAVLLLGRASSQDRPTLLTILPNDKGGFTCLADCGANVDCKPSYLLKFGEYATDYCKKVLAIESPRVGLLSVGTEDKKGNAVTKEAFTLLKESDLNFVGNIESKAALSGDVDIVVADGFWGNILLKSIEGTTKSVAERLYCLLKKHSKSQEDMRFVNDAMAELMSILDTSSQGGAILLGAKKPIVKAHGYATENTVLNTVKQAIKICKT